MSRWRAVAGNERPCEHAAAASARARRDSMPPGPRSGRKPVHQRRGDLRQAQPPPDSLLDPVWTTETATRAFALQKFGSLYGVDEKLTAYPQMADGQTVEDDRRRWSIRWPSLDATSLSENPRTVLELNVEGRKSPAAYYATCDVFADQLMGVPCNTSSASSVCRLPSAACF